MIHIRALVRQDDNEHLGVSFSRIACIVVGCLDGGSDIRNTSHNNRTLILDATTVLLVDRNILFDEIINLSFPQWTGQQVSTNIKS